MRDLGKSIDYLLFFVSERATGADWRCAHVTVCVCNISGYCLTGDNGS